jgi:hypothetical protein
VTADGFTAAAVFAAREDMQHGGDFYVELAMTGAVVAAETPYSRRAVAGFLRGVMARAPLTDSPAYEPHRSILGALVAELEASAITGALDPAYAAAEIPDLRDPATAAREQQLLRETRDWAELERARATAAIRANVDDMLAVSAHEHARATQRLEDATREAEAFLATPAPAEPTDAGAWLA